MESQPGRGCRVRAPRFPFLGILGTGAVTLFGFGGPQPSGL